MFKSGGLNIQGPEDNEKPSCHNRIVNEGILRLTRIVSHSPRDHPFQPFGGMDSSIAEKPH